MFVFLQFEHLYLFDMQLHYYWLIAAIILIIVEIFTAGFGAVCFAFGALASALVGYLGGSFTWQPVRYSSIGGLPLSGREPYF